MRQESELREYQVRARNFMLNRDHTAMFIDMGLGKTVAALSAIKWMKERGEKRKVLIVAPIKICETVWPREITEWAHLNDLKCSVIRGTANQRLYNLHRDADLYLINPHVLKWLSVQLRGDFSRFYWMIVDESTMFKDGKAQWSKTAHKVSAAINKRTILTGTPRPNSAMDLWSQMMVVDGGARFGKSITSFRERFFQRGMNLAPHVYKWDVRPEAVKTMDRLIADCAFQLRAADYGMLPPVVPQCHFIQLPTPVRDMYTDLEKEALTELNGHTWAASHGGSKVMMCRQMANGALYNEVGSKQWTLLHDEKIEALKDIIDALDQNVLLVYEFKHDLERLQAAFPHFVKLDKKGTQQTIDAWNAGRIPGLLVHPASDAHGLNLQYGGNHIIFFSMTWSLERHDQIIARLARSGQAASVVVSHYIQAQDTVDELIYEALQTKGDEQERFRKGLDAYLKRVTV